ncbi:peptidylprolyl isomerase [Flavobacterium psychrotrophum]|uniref:peptidylprolyl isomerase n=1 Tax=Flavobacterium psychrotrophum TaxID=2294119 RepID=UPI000E30D47D|nr:peptidylprolyl isomerase [Flavobacterium psychrotrophum]
MKLNQVFSGLLLTALIVTGCKSSKETTTTNAAPATKKDVLFTVNDKPYYTDEFVRVYNKNLDLVKDDSQKDLDNYLDLFVGYKLKVNKAYKLGLQDNKKYQGELRSYRNQLAKNYLTDSKVTTELVEEAYKRSQKEVRASHMLFLVDENATPADTLKAYNKAVEARKRVTTGEDFAKVAKELSEDPSAKENGGDLGYFSVFRMVYPFESGAYNTPVGQVSKPIRTRFGYHVIKVNDIRDNRGDITVAHIMALKPKDPNSADAAKAKSKIEDIYKKLQQGEDFTALAKQFSEDKSSSENGGLLNTFSSGELTSQVFEDQSFLLKTPGEISKPFESQFGWHIVKLVERKAAKPYEEVKADFESRTKRDERSRLIAESVTGKLKKKYAVTKDKEVYKLTQKAISDSVYKMTWKLPANLEPYNKTLVIINNDKKLTGKDFLTYVSTQQNMGISAKPLSNAVDVLYNQYVDEQLNVYYNDNLEKEFPEFSLVMEEYRDGLLLFDLMEKEIWDKAKNDTIGIQKFYNAHLADYQWKQRAEVEVYSSLSETTAKQARELLLKNKDAVAIKAKLNTKDKISIIEKTGTFETGSDAMPKLTDWKPGVSTIVKEANYYYVVKVVKVLPAGAKTLDEARGRVINDYQQYLESTWVDDLKKEFTVKVNNDVFENVKKEIKH